MAKQYYCFLERFNNYFNRKIIKYESLSDYISHSKDSFIPTDSNGGMTPFDFNPNDNVTTEIIVNDVPFDPDYFLLLDENQTIVQRWFVLEQKRNRKGQWLYQLKRDVISDNLDTLLNAPIFVEKGMLREDDSFIVNSEGLSLNQIKESELLIIDNSKTAWIVGYMAKNAGGSDISIQVDTENLKIDYVTLADIASAMDTTEGVLNNFVNTDGGTNSKGYFTTSISMKVYCAYVTGNDSANSPYNYNFAPDFASGTGYLGTDSYFSKPYLFISTLGNNPQNMTEPFRQAVLDKQLLWQNQISSMLGKSYYLTQRQLDILWSFNGKHIRYDGKYYQITINELSNHSTTVNRIKKDGTYSALEETCSKTVELVGTSIQPFSASDYNPLYSDAGQLDTLTSNEKEVAISLSLIADSDVIPQLNTTISSGRNITGDQEYDIFAIPLKIEVDNGGSFETSEEYARRIASAIVREENAKVYDLQLLPYCPLPSLIVNDGEIEITSLTEHTDFDYIFKNVSNVNYAFGNKGNMTFTPDGDGKWNVTETINMSSVPVGKTGTIVDLWAHVNFDMYGYIDNLQYTQTGNSVAISFDYYGIDPSDASLQIYSRVDYTYPEDDVPCGIMFYLTTATFKATISTSSLNPYWNDRFDASKKIISNCFMNRIVSPNYQGAFEFNVAKNGGKVDYFNVFCTYKPFTPFIKVAPNFNWLYGSEYGDNRGLICGGDFSLPRVTDEWRSYELNNKNYQNIFNRDIQHMDFLHSIEMRNQLVSGGVEILSDVAKGAGAGAMLGGGWGALAGGIVGGGASAVGFGIDVDTLARTQRENRQLAIDKFNYQLGNVKALPYTLTKVGSFDVISKIFPFVETYSCSEEELEAFKNKIKYESMTVMRIGTLQEFINYDEELHYFKGSLIRNDEIADDPHILNAIYEELLKGVYI